MPKYLFFVQSDPSDPLTWRLLKRGKTTECDTYDEALEAAVALARTEGRAGEPAEKLRLNVAVVSERNWNPGTATVQLVQVTEWEKK